MSTFYVLPPRPLLGDLVADFYQRTPLIRPAVLVDACLEWEQLSGEALR